MHAGYAIVCVLIRRTGDCPQLIKTPYRVCGPQIMHEHMLIAQYIQLSYCRSVDDTTISRLESCMQAIQPYVS